MEGGAGERVGLNDLFEVPFFSSMIYNGTP